METITENELVKKATHELNCRFTETDRLHACVALFYQGFDADVSLLAFDKWEETRRENVN